MYAIVQSGGKQSKVSVGDLFKVEKLETEVGSELALDVLMISDDSGNVKVGAPLVEGASVKARVVGHGKGDKVIVFHYRPKKNIRKKQGHRQPYTELEVLSIG